MSLDDIRMILVLIVLTTFLSCKGQVKIENQTIQNQVTQKDAILTIKLDKKIWCIYQDQKNNYWFGSNGNGVFCYDGKTLKRYTTQDGLIDNSIRGIQGDHLGNVYIQTPEGISKFDGKTFTTLVPMIFSSSQWKLEPNYLWFNCNGSAKDVYRYDGESLFELALPRQDLKKAFDLEDERRIKPYSVFGIDKDKAGNLWIGTAEAGAFRYDGTSFLWFDEKELSTLPDGRVPGVRSMTEDKDGNVWLSNFISKYKIIVNGDTTEYEKLEGVDMSKGNLKNRFPYFLSGLLDDNGDLWMATYSDGIWKYDGRNLLNIPIKDGEREVLLISIYKDNQGVLWLGTDNAGAFKYNGKDFVKFESGMNLNENDF